jgi:hypothetical protein
MKDSQLRQLFAPIPLGILTTEVVAPTGAHLIVWGEAGATFAGQAGAVDVVGSGTYASPTTGVLCTGDWFNMSFTKAKQVSGLLYYSIHYFGKE